VDGKGQATRGNVFVWELADIASRNSVGDVDVVVAKTDKARDYSPLPVALDVWGVSSAQPRGVVNLKRQFARACAVLAKAGDLKICYAGADSDRHWLIEEGLLGQDSKFRRFRIPGRLQRVMAQVPPFSWSWLLGNPRLYHSFGTYGFDGRHTQVIGTLVDFVPMRVPEFVPPAFTLEQERWCEWAERHPDSKWIAISEQVKRDALELGQLREAQVEVVRLCAEDDMFCSPVEEAVASTLDEVGIRQPYILCVNTLNPRKNHVRLLDAWQQGGFEGQGWMLVLVGHPAGNVLAERLASGEFRGVKWLGYVPRDRLVHLYYGCEAFAYPSMYEGFGIPVAEAIVAGKAILTSSGSAMADIVGEGARYVDPWDTTEILRGLSEIVSSRSLRERLGAHNAAQREDFSLDRLSGDLLRAYRRVSRWT
jgi:glycosyltransferase involved in cell wall biosynthesis